MRCGTNRIHRDCIAFHSPLGDNQCSLYCRCAYSTGNWTFGRHPGVAVAGIPGAASRRLPVQRVLPALPGLCPNLARHPAPESCAGRAPVRRLQRPDRSGHRRRHRGGASSPNLRGRARGIELYLCRSDLDPGAGRLVDGPRAGFRLFRRGPRDRGTGQPQGRGAGRPPLRTGPQPQLRRLGGPLRRGGPPGAGGQAARQRSHNSR